MNGKILMSGLIISALAIGAGIWYSSTIGSYDTVADVTEIPVNGEMRAVSNYQGIDGVSSPLKLRACFDVNWDYVEDAAATAEATPLVTPGWFDCFDAVQIGEDLAKGRATAFVAEANNPFGFSIYVCLLYTSDAADD